MAERGRPYGTYGIKRYQIRLFCEVIGQMGTIKDACKAAEISPGAFYRYRDRCKDAQEGILVDFRTAYAQALEDAQKAHDKKVAPILEEQLRRHWNRHSRQLKRQFGYKNYEDFCKALQG